MLKNWNRFWYYIKMVRSNWENHLQSRFQDVILWWEGLSIRAQVYCNPQVDCCYFGVVSMSRRVCQLKTVMATRISSLKQLRTILHLTWWASFDSTFQNFSKPVSHSRSQRWHFRQHDRKDVMSVAFQVFATVVSTSSVNFTLLTASHPRPCQK